MGALLSGGPAVAALGLWIGIDQSEWFRSILIVAAGIGWTVLVALSFMDERH